MKRRLYVIYDDQMEEVVSPVVQEKNDAVILRSFQQQLQDGDLNNDYHRLVCIGEIDTETMAISPMIYDVVARFDLVEEENQDVGI